MKIHTQIMENDIVKYVGILSLGLKAIWDV